MIAICPAACLSPQRAQQNGHMFSFLIIMFFLALPCLLVSQTLSSLGGGSIVELESAQSSVTQTWVTASMERSGHHSRVLIHRSDDNGASWMLVDSITPYTGDSEIPDPVITADGAGNFYLVVMRVFNRTPPSATVVDLELYRSEDDGRSWSYISSPHKEDVIADYPQLISGGNSELFLVYSNLREFPVVENAPLVFRKSVDGGVSWSSKIQLDMDSVSSIGADISLAQNGSLIITSGNRKDANIYSYISEDQGESWSKLEVFSNPNEEMGYITKPVSNPTFSHFGVIAHKAHQESTPIVFHAWYDEAVPSSVLAEGAYAQGIMDASGTIHIVYNKKENSGFVINYLVSTDKGRTFSEPVAIFSGAYTSSALGEYQSLELGQDGLFHLTFCDWTDDSKGKTLVFSPLITKVEQAEKSAFKVFPNPTTGKFSLELTDGFKPLRIRVINLEGKTMQSFPIRSNRGKQELDITNLDKGMYLLRLEEQNRYFVTAILKL